MTPEHKLMNEVRAWCGSKGYLAFHCNVGIFYTPDGRKCATGLPEGFSDLLVLDTHGNTSFVETKVHPRRPTSEQVRFIDEMRARGFRAGVAYTLEEAIAVITGCHL